MALLTALLPDSCGPLKPVRQSKSLDVQTRTFHDATDRGRRDDSGRDQPAGRLPDRRPADPAAVPELSGPGPLQPTPVGPAGAGRLSAAAAGVAPAPVRLGAARVHPHPHRPAVPDRAG